MTAFPPRKPQSSPVTGTRRWLRLTARWLYGIHAWSVFVVLVAAFCVLGPATGNSNRARRLAHRVARLICRFAGLPLEVRGIERLPAGAHVLLVNHGSFLDAIVLIALLPPVPGYTFTTRREFAAQVLLYPILRSVRTIILKRPDDPDHTQNVETLTSALQQGQNLVIFPEGGFVPEPGVRQFHSGAFIAAAGARRPVVVAGLRGARMALRSGTWLPLRSRIELAIGPVIWPEGGAGPQMQALIADARTAMASLAGEAAV